MHQYLMHATTRGIADDVLRTSHAVAMKAIGGADGAMPLDAASSEDDQGKLRTRRDADRKLSRHHVCYCAVVVVKSYSARMPVTLRQTVYASVICITFMACGIFLVHVAWIDWVHREIRLTHHTVPRLISFAANRNEFILRCACLTLFGGFWLWTGFGTGYGLLYRVAVLRQRFFVGVVKPPFTVLLPLWTGLSCFAVWFPLIVFIELHYP
jgi:hypothetical protein